MSDKSGNLYEGSLSVTTLGYLENDGRILMLFRNKKKDDLNEGKWVGIGGHVKRGETPMEGFLREVREESGITELSVDCVGTITFLSDQWEDEKIYLYYGTTEQTELPDCDEGELHWIEKEKILSLKLWEGDPYFLRPMLAGEKDIRMEFRYRGEELAEIRRAES